MSHVDHRRSRIKAVIDVAVGTKTDEVHPQWDDHGLDDRGATRCRLGTAHGEGECDALYSERRREMREGAPASLVASCRIMIHSAASLVAQRSQAHHKSLAVWN